MTIRKPNVKMVPPDGGWGWLVVIGSSLINFSTKAIEPSFGLLFGDLLRQLDVETTGASLVISTLDSMIHFSGLVVGPLIKRYAYRKVAILGGVLSSAAILLTVPANSMLHILITVGFIGGIGFGLATACTLVGVNDFFSKKKGQAVGLSMVGTAVGFMIMPQVVRILLDLYDFRSALLVIGGLSLHAIVGACLFQPVSWHLKPLLMEKEKAELKMLVPHENIKETSTNGLKHNLSSPHLDSGRHLLGISSQGAPRKPSIISNVSLLADTGSILHLHEIAKHKTEANLEKVIVDAENNPLKKKKNCWSRFSKLMDLDLLRDGVYLNILYGLSIYAVAEMNFKLIVPFFLSDLGFTKSLTAYSLSIMAISDIAARVIIPPILDRLTFSRRITFIFGSFCVGFCRSCLALQTTFVPIITIFIIIGFFRGIVLTSYQTVLTEYASGDNYPSVLGLSMVARGIFIAAIGPLSGFVRDYTKSFPLYIHFQSILIFSAVVCWSIELLITQKKVKKGQERILQIMKQNH